MDMDDKDGVSVRVCVNVSKAKQSKAINGPAAPAANCQARSALGRAAAHWLLLSLTPGVVPSPPPPQLSLPPTVPTHTHTHTPKHCPPQTMPGLSIPGGAGASSGPKRKTSFKCC